MCVCVCILNFKCHFHTISMFISVQMSYLLKRYPVLLLLFQRFLSSRMMLIVNYTLRSTFLFECITQNQHAPNFDNDQFNAYHKFGTLDEMAMCRANDDKLHNFTLRSKWLVHFCEKSAFAKRYVFGVARHNRVGNTYTLFTVQISWFIRTLRLN